MAAKTDTTPYHGHFALYMGGFITASLLFVATAYLARHGVSQAELSWFSRINEWPDKWRSFFIVCNIVSPALWIAAAVVVLTSIFQMYRLAWRLAACSLVGFVIAVFTKHFITRPQPQSLLPTVHSRAAEVNMGFPSYHVLFVTIFMLAIVPYLPWRWRWIVPLPIGLMMLARIYLGLNLPLDTIAGFTLGLSVIAFVRILSQPIKVLFRLD